MRHARSRPTLEGRVDRPGRHLAHRTAVGALVLTAALGTALTGCSGGSSPDAGSSSTTSTTAGSAQTSSARTSSAQTSSAQTSSAGSASTGSTTVTDSPSPAAGGPAVSLTGTEKPATSVTVPFRTTNTTGTVRIDVLPLQTRGKLMDLTVVFTPTFTPAKLAPTQTIFNLLSNHSFIPTLVDHTNLKLYTVASALTVMRANDVGVSVPSGSPLYAWAVFSAPQDRISSIDVQLSDTLPRFANVPVQ